MIIKNCLNCTKEFRTYLCRIKKGWGIYCSPKCRDKYGRDEETKQKISNSLKEQWAKGIRITSGMKGKVAWNKGKQMPQISGEKSPTWKGDKVGYFGLHKWVQKNLGKPNRCDFCGTNENKRYDWANKSHQYKRDLTDWIRLCIPCHREYDKITVN